jgi:hypothetical protein
MNQIVPIPAIRLSLKAPRGIAVPAPIAAVGNHAARRFLKFFAATIRNKNIRMAYYRAVTELVDIEPRHVAVAGTHRLRTRMFRDHSGGIPLSSWGRTST